MSGLKTDYFGTFLDVLSRGAATAANLAASHQDLTATAIRIIAAHGGSLSLPELFAPPFNSMKTLLETAQELEKFGFVERDGAKITLTDAGKAMAQKLPQIPAPTTT
jgi:hypothetical protein